MIKNTFLAVAFVLVFNVANVAQGQFAGASFWNQTPSSTMGAVTNNLVVTDTANGFVISGQAIVNVAPGPNAGTLLTWTRDRPLDFPYGPNNLTTTTVLDGFSLPPIGTVGNTQGLVESIFTDYLGTTTSLSMVPMSLVNGVDTPLWINLSSTSAVFSHTATAGQFMRQTFTLDGNYMAGAGGSWVIDVPVTSKINVVPEPSSGTLLAIASTIFIGFRRRTNR